MPIKMNYQCRVANVSRKDRIINEEIGHVVESQETIMLR